MPSLLESIHIPAALVYWLRHAKAGELAVGQSQGG